MAEKYDRKPKKIWYNTQTCVPSKNKQQGEHVILFDSISEFNLYKYLSFTMSAICPVDVKPHDKIRISRDKHWKVDFRLDVLDKSDYEFLHYLVRGCNHKNIQNTEAPIYLEYKGVLNKDYLKKQAIITKDAPYIDNRLIVLSAESKAVLIERAGLDYNVKHIHSVEYFKRLVNQFGVKNDCSN